MAQAQAPGDGILLGRNAVLEALSAGRGIQRLLVAEGAQDGSMRPILAMARERGIPVEAVPRAGLDRAADGGRHQGVVAYVPPVPYQSVEDILAAAGERGEPPFLLLLDGLEDPHNLGAILRTADATGAHGVLLPKRRSVRLSATVAKTSAGAVEHVPVAQIGNVAQTLKSLKAMGLWAVGADMAGGQRYDEADLGGPVVLVVGGEGHGISRLARESCDLVLSIPMVGRINSLNASVAASLLMYEVLRQRLHAAGKTGESP